MIEGGYSTNRHPQDGVMGAAFMLRLRHLEVSPGEAEVLLLLADGFSNSEIAAALHLSPSGIESRVHRLAERLNVRGRRLIAWACSHSDCCIADAAKSERRSRGWPC